MAFWITDWEDMRTSTRMPMTQLHLLLRGRRRFALRAASRFSRSTKEGLVLPFKAAWRPLTLILLVGMAAGVLNVLFFHEAMPPLTADAGGALPTNRWLGCWHTL